METLFLPLVYSNSIRKACANNLQLYDVDQFSYKMLKGELLMLTAFLITNILMEEKQFK
jgi:hypothetical protein